MLLQKSELSQKDTKPSMHTCKIEVWPSQRIANKQTTFQLNVLHLGN